MSKEKEVQTESRWEPWLAFTEVHTTHEQKHLMEELKRIGAPVSQVIIAIQSKEQEALLDDSLFDWGSHDGEIEAERYDEHKLAL